jgi:hypothetical protein
VSLHAKTRRFSRCSSTLVRRFCPLGNGFTPAHALATRPRALDCLRLLAERGVCATTSSAGRSPLFFAVRCLATFVWLHERGASLSPSLRRLRSIFRGFRLRIRTAPVAPLDAPLDAAILNGAIDVVEFLLANGALVDERALIKSARHALVFQRMLMLLCDHCCADFETAVVGALAQSAARSERRVVGAASVRCCVRRAGRQRVARIHPDAADASNASLSTRS